MRPEGRKSFKSRGKEDIHPRGDYKNWREDIIPPNKRKVHRSIKCTLHKLKGKIWN